MRLWSTLLFACVSLAAPLALAAPSSAPADVEEPKDERLEDRTRRLGDRIKSVQRKVFLKRLRHELTAFGGLSLNDSFYQQFTVGGAYTFHVTEHFAIEANAKWHPNPVRTNAVAIVRATEVATPNVPFLPVLSLTGDLQFTPLYGKMSLMGAKIVHYDIYLSGGFGAVYTQNQATPWRPLGTAAIGARVMLLDWLTVRFEVRDQIYQDNRSGISASVIQNLVLFNLGVSFFLPPSFDYRYE